MSAADILATAQLYFDFTTDSARLDGQPHVAADLLTCARGQAATAPDSAGVWHQFGTNDLRLTDNGLLVEFSKYNAISNNTFTGAHLGFVHNNPANMPTGWTLSGFAGLTVEIVNLTVENGIECADFRVKGTATSTGGEFRMTGVTDVQAPTPQMWTGSFFTSLRAGQMLHKMTNWSLMARQFDASQVGLTNLVLTDNLHQTVFDQTLRRVVGSAAMAAAGGAYAQPIIVFGWNATQPVDFTVRIGWPQFEQGNFASSPVRTVPGTGSGIRFAETIDLKPSVLTLSRTEGTIYVEYAFGPNPVATEQKGLFAIGSANSDLIHAWLDTDVRLLRVAGLHLNSTTLGPITSGTLQYGGVVHKLATAFGANELRATYDGAAGIPDLSGAMPDIGISYRLGLGRFRIDISDQHIDGFLRRFAYWPTRLSDADFSVLTAGDILDNPALDLDFVANKGFSQGKVGTALEFLSVSSGNGGWVDTIDGDWAFYTYDLPRRSDKGLLVEGGKMNEMVNGKLLGAAIGTIKLSGSTGSLPTLWYQSAWAGPFLSVTGIGVDHGIDYIDIAITGTSTGTSDSIFLEYYAPPVTGNGAINQGDPWAAGIFLANMGDNLNNLTNMTFHLGEYGPSHNFLADTVRADNLAIKLTRRLQRVCIAGNVKTQTAVVTLSTMAPWLTFGWEAGSLLDLHFRIGWPTIERGGFASSPMATITYSVPTMRQADTIQVTSSLLTTDPLQGTLVVEYIQPPASLATELQGAVSFDGGGPANRVYITSTQPGSVPLTVARNNSAITLQVDAPIGIPDYLPLTGYGHLMKIATAFAANDMRTAFNGRLGTPDTVGAFPPGNSLISIGRSNGGNAEYLDSYLHRLRYWPTRLSNAQLQELTATAADIAALPIPPTVPADFADARLYMDFTKSLAKVGNWLTAPNNLLSVTRNNPGWVDDASGTWRMVPGNQPRISDRGLLIEDQRQNLIRNNSMQGAGIGTAAPNDTLPDNWAMVDTRGLAVEVAGFGVDHGMDYIDIRFSGVTGAAGTAVVAFETATGITSTFRDSYPVSFFMAIVGGNLSHIDQINIWVAGNTAAGVNTAVRKYPLPMTALTGTLKRFATPFYDADATDVRAQPGFGLDVGAGVAVDITLRVAWPQYEGRPSNASSPIRTIGVPLTRYTDVVTVRNLTSWFTAGQPATVYVEFQCDIPADDSGTPLYFKSSTNGQDVHFSYDLATGGEVYGYSPNAQMRVDHKPVTNIIRAVMTYNTNDATFYIDGVIANIGTPDTDATIPTGINQLILGAAGIGQGYYLLQGYLRKLAYWPSRLANPRLITMTTPPA